MNKYFEEESRIGLYLGYVPDDLHICSNIPDYDKIFVFYVQDGGCWAVARKRDNGIQDWILRIKYCPYCGVNLYD